MCGLMLPSATFPTPKNSFPTLGKNGGNRKTLVSSTSSARTTSCSTASSFQLCSRRKAHTSFPTTFLPTNSSTWKTTKSPPLATGRCGCTNISKISLANKTCCAMCSRQMRLKRRTTISRGQISKRATTTNSWLSMATS